MGGMAALVWMADRLWGSVGMGVLLVLALAAAFALPELLLMALAELQREDPGEGHVDGARRPVARTRARSTKRTGPLRGAGPQVPKGGLEPPT